MGKEFILPGGYSYEEAFRRYRNYLERSITEDREDKYIGAILKIAYSSALEIFDTYFSIEGDRVD